ncbi:hypothetical protein AgCh_017494 [Apium graveolens]
MRKSSSQELTEGYAVTNHTVTEVSCHWCRNDMVVVPLQLVNSTATVECLRLYLFLFSSTYVPPTQRLSRIGFIVGYALTAPTTISGDHVLTLWRTGVYDDGGAFGTPSIVFEFDNKIRVVTPQTVRDALHLPTHDSYSIFVGDAEMRIFFNEIGYDKDMKNLGQRKMNGLRKEWNFFFDCITRAFNNKCTNFDALPNYDTTNWVPETYGLQSQQSAKMLEITVENPYVAHPNTAAPTLPHTQSTSGASQKTHVLKRKKQAELAISLIILIENPQDIIVQSARFSDHRASAANADVAQEKDTVQASHFSKPSESVRRNLVLADLESSDEDNAPLSSKFKNLKDDFTSILIVLSTDQETTTSDAV